MFLQFDYYGEPAKLKVQGADTFPSCFGALLSIAILTTAIAYGLDKLDIMETFGDTLYQEYEIPFP